MDSIKHNSRIPQLRFPGFEGEWEEKTLGEVCERITEKVAGLELEPISVSAGTGIISQKQRFGKNISGEQYKNYIHIKKGDYCYNKGNSKQFPQGCIYELKEFEDAAAPNAFISFRFNKNVCSHFFNGYFDNNAHGKLLARYITSGARSDGLLNINAEDFFSIKFLIPSTIQEQQKIADCLSEIDYMIVAQEQKVESLKAHKKGLMQRLFPQPGETSPCIRFPGFTAEWEEKTVNEKFTRITRKNGENNLNVLTISAQYGLISQLNFFKKSVAAADVTGYYLLHRGDFAYNKSSSQGKPVGAIKPLKLYDKGVVSTLYICFKCNDPREIGFWEQYFDAGLLDNELMSIAQEGARNHGLLNIPTSGFFGLKVFSPSIAEQQKIANCLSSFDEIIAAEESKVEALKAHKKGLMQQLFPQTIK